MVAIIVSSLAATDTNLSKMLLECPHQIDIGVKKNVEMLSTRTGGQGSGRIGKLHLDRQKRLFEY